MPVAITSRFSWPKVPGDSPWCQADVVGPASYQQITIGTPPTGGQLIVPKDFGLVSFHFVWAMGSDNGQYEGVVIPVLHVPGADAFMEARIVWKLVATGAEAAGGVNLQNRFLRLLALGN